MLLKNETADKINALIATLQQAIASKQASGLGAFVKNSLFGSATDTGHNGQFKLILAEILQPDNISFLNGPDKTVLGALLKAAVMLHPKTMLEILMEISQRNNALSTVTRFVTSRDILNHSSTLAWGGGIGEIALFLLTSSWATFFLGNIAAVGLGALYLNTQEPGLLASARDCFWLVPVLNSHASIFDVILARNEPELFQSLTAQQSSQQSSYRFAS